MGGSLTLNSGALCGSEISDYFSPACATGSCTFSTFEIIALTSFQQRTSTMSDFLENEAEESSGSDSEAEHGSQRPTKKRAIIDSDDEEEGKCLFKNT